ncbi:MAG: hypothetical protein AABX37_00145, partial [Nanoarchaeota archaeon]
AVKKKDGKLIDIDTLYWAGVGIDANGNLQGKDNVLVSPDGRVVVDNNNIQIVGANGDLKNAGTLTGTITGPISSIGDGENRLPVIPLQSDKVSVGGITMPKDVYEKQVKSVIGTTGGTVSNGIITLPASPGQTAETIKIETHDNGDSAITHTLSVSNGQTATPRTVYTIGVVEIVQEGTGNEAKITYDGKPYVGTVDFDTGTVTLHGTGGTLEIKNVDGKRVVTTCETNTCDGQPRVERVVENDGNALVRTYGENGQFESMQGKDKNGNILSEATFSLDSSNNQVIDSINHYGYVDANGNPLSPDDPRYGKPWNRRTVGIDYTNCDSTKGTCEKSARYDPQTGQITGGDKNAKAFLQEIRDDEAFRFGETAGQEAFRGAFVEQRFNFRGTAALFGWDSYGEWAQDVEKFFAANLLGIEPLSSAICDARYGLGSDTIPQNIAVIETQSGTYQTVAHIEAEVSPGGFHPCSEEGTCPADLECHDDGFCYAADENTPKETFFYKITWGVTAPKDEKFTPRIDEDKQPVTFNIQLKSSGFSVQPIYLFKNPQTQLSDVNTLQLDNGQKSSQFWNEVIAEYSLYQFTEACIVWGVNKPKTLDRFCLGECLKNVPDVCVSIEPAKPLSTNDAREDIGLAKRTEERPGEYCGLNGC